MAKEVGDSGSPGLCSPPEVASLASAGSALRPGWVRERGRETEVEREIEGETEREMERERDRGKKELARRRALKVVGLMEMYPMQNAELSITDCW